ncbi:lipoxygenase homology domain-containing protein 1-like isoform X1 [Styela clava]
MQYMNSSPVMTMILQPEFSPAPRQPNAYMVMAPSTPPHVYGSFRRKDKSSNYPPPRVSKYTEYASPQRTTYSSSRRPYTAPHTQKGTQTPWSQPEHTTRSPRIIRRPASSSSSSTSRFNSVRRPPYAPRMMDATATSAMQSYPAAPNNAKLPEYDPLYDPHLMDFYAKKYGLRPQPPRGTMERRWSVTGHGMNSSMSGSVKSYRFGSAKERRSYEGYGVRSRRKAKRMQEIEYKVTVRTGTKQGCGTDARVFLRINGRQGKTQKTRLCKKSGQSNINMFRFAKGSSHTFKIRGMDVGEIKSIVVESDGLEERHSWFLQEIIVQRKDRSYTFNCERWFSLFKGDCQLTRELNAVSGKQAKKIDYEVTVVTGDKRGAGTDAKVFLTVHGSKGSSPRLQLKNDRYNTFERNKSDVFSLRTVNVGKIRRIRIEIDNQGFAPAWYLERVVLLTSSQRVYFACGEWLSDDDQLYRDLVGSDDATGVGKKNQYTVTVFTGDIRGAGTDANVSLTLFGDMGDSGKKKLDDKHNNFERGRKDVFTVKCPNVGKLKKLRIGHDNSGSSPGWYLEKVMIDDNSTGRIYTFPCGRWFAKDEDDGRITRELVAGKGDGGIPYTVKVHTGDVRGAGTSANVYIIMYGGRRGQDNTGRIELQGNFERNRQVICNVESASMLSPLEKIEIGHDNNGAGPGWFLDKVIVICNSTGCEQVFPCSKWFATDEGDGLISRELYESKSLRKQIVQKSAWNCVIWTTDKRSAGTDAKVFLQVYGSEGKSGEIRLNNESDNFESGQKDSFKIDFVNVGTIYKLRVWHDNSRSFPGWHLDKIVLEPVLGGKKSQSYTFNCGKWLDSSEGDGEIIRELPASGPLVKKPQPLVRYIVSVTTGNKTNAGTDANVFCCLFGEQGDTGERPLVKTKSSRNKFERKNVDEFVFEAVTLKRLTKVKIGHDDTGVGPGWFLEKVEVWEEGRGDKMVFPCERWLATDEDDGHIVRELMPEGTPQLLNTTTYHVSVKTGDVSGAGTDANVFLKIIGGDGDTGRLKLHQSENIRDKFERGRTDLFKLEATDIGKLERIEIGHDDSGIASGWFLDGIEIDVPSSGLHYTFNCHRWLASDEDDGRTFVELYPTHTRQQDKLLPYEITVTTGDKLNAGTDANVTLQIYGEDGKSEVLKLRNRTDNFERDAVDKFKVEAQDVGPITKIRIGHNGKGVGPGWFLDSVKVQRFVKRTSKRKKRRRESVSPEKGDVETYWFVCRRWFDKNEDDGQIMRELVPTDELGRVLDEALQEKEYTVHVFTGDKLGAGTDADVFMILYGENGDTGERKLDKSETNINKFERKQEDIFKMRAADLGTLKKIKIRRDDAVVGAAWFLDRIEVRSSDGRLIFPCQRWLSTKEDDGQIERTLVPVSEEVYQRLQEKNKRKTNVRDAIALETKAQLTTYEVTVKTGDVRGAGTDANVYMMLYGENDDSGKINLKTSKTYSDKFEKNHADIFTVEASDLGNLKKIKIGHDNSGLLGAAWYLEYVDIDAPSMGLKWHFPCGRWLAKDKDDGLLERELYPAADETLEYMKKVPYEFAVTTSDVSGAGTDANVYVVLYGRDGIQTEQVSLCPNKDDRKSKFEKKQTDTFVIEMDDIGDTIEKLRIGHDGKGWGAGWHLDKVQVRRLLEGDKGHETYLFNCGRWLARDEDDGQIIRELVPTKKIEEKMSRRGQMKRMESTLSDTLKNQQYKVHVFTGDKFNAGTDANVHITLFGENGDSGERKLLKSETYSDKFERGHEDIFTIEAVDLGKLHKVHIRHDNSLLNPAWFLGRVEIEDCETNQKFVFHCERWLAKGKDDGKIGRSLYVVGYDGETSTKRSVMTSRSFSSLGSRRLLSEPLVDGPTIPYTIKVRTGTLEGASCSADGFVRIFGPKSKGGQKVSHKIPLIPEKGKFKKGTVETFNVEALDVGELKAIEIGHTGVDERWYIEEIIIDQPTLGKNWVFPCLKWFSRDRDDGHTSRMLSVADASSNTYKAKVQYEITVYTGDESGAGTDGKISMSVYGSKGNTPDIMILKSEEEGVLLERGSVDVIRTEIDDIAPLKMVKLTHNGKGQRPDWYCEKVHLRNLETGKVTVFPCDSWLSKSKGNKKLSLELSASVGGRSVLKRTTFKITVKTSETPGSGTNANVFIQLFGDHGESGELHLNKSETHRNMFEAGNEDVFVFNDKLSIGEIRKCRIWHDSKGFRPGWHLDWIEVRDETSNRNIRFNCGRWLSKDEDDGQTMRELQPLGGSRPTSSSSSRRTRSPSVAIDAKPTKYEVTVVTAEEKGSGTDANVCITIYGENSDSGKRPLKQKFRDLFEKGRTDKFTLEILNMGELTKVRVEHDDAGFNSDWLCDHIVIKDTSTGRAWDFPCREWIGGKKGNGQLHRDLLPRPL